MDGRLTLAALVIALTAWLGILIVAWPTYQGLGPASGTVAACADAVLHGEAPGFARGATFLGTTVFPPVPLLTAAAKRTGMSWRASLRWVDLLGMLALVASVALAGQALGGSGVAMTVSIAVLLVSGPFVGASLAGRSEPFATALSIGALAAWCHDPRRQGWWAPALAAAAWLVRPAAVTVPLAVVLAAGMPGARRGAGPFAARFVTALAAGIALTIPWHGPGWYADVMHTVLFASPASRFPLRGPFELLRVLGTSAELTVAAGLSIVYLTGEWSRGRPMRPFAAAALLVALVALMQRSSDHGALLELAAIGAIGAGLWAEHANRREAVLGAALVLIVVTGGAWREAQRVGSEAHASESRRGAVLAALRGSDGPVLAEDPLLPLAAGQRAEIADAAALRSLLRRRDSRALQVAARLDSSGYARVVLDAPIGGRNEARYRDLMLGVTITAALARRYELEGEADGFSLYRPIEFVKH
jgi:hypothetical protein